MIAAAFAVAIAIDIVIECHYNTITTAAFCVLAL